MRRIMHALTWVLGGVVVAAVLTVGGYRIGREQRRVETAAIAPQATRAPTEHRPLRPPRPITVASSPTPRAGGSSSPDSDDIIPGASATLGDSAADPSPSGSGEGSDGSDSTCRDDDGSGSDSSGPGSGGHDSNSGSGSSGSGSSGSDSSGSGSDGSGSTDCD